MLARPIFKRVWTGMSLLVLAFFLGLVIGSRFYSLPTAGVMDNDAFQFLSISKDYSQGHIYPIYYKYIYVFLGALSIHIMGYHDFNLHYVSAIADVINIALILLIMRALRLPLLIAIGAASLYAFVPQVLYHARWPLSNPVAVASVLCAIYCAMVAVQATSWRRVALLAASGFSAIFGVMAHPTTLVAVPIVGGAVVVVDIIRVWPRRPDLRMVGSWVAYGLGGLLAFIILAVMLWAGEGGAGKMIPCYPMLAPGATGGSKFSLWAAFWDHAIWGIAGFRQSAIDSYATSKTMAFLAYVKSIYVSVRDLMPRWLWVAGGSAVVILAWEAVVCAVRRRRWSCMPQEAAQRAMLVFCVCFVVLFILSFLTMKEPGLTCRYFLPLVPVVVLAAAIGLWSLLCCCHVPRCLVAMILFGASTYGSCVMFISYLPDFRALIKPGLFRQLAVVLDGKLDDRHRLLIAPSTFDVGTGYFSLYFRPLPMQLRPGWKIPEVKDALAQFGIRYVFVGGPYLTGILYYYRYAANYGALPDNYTLEQEYAELNALMREVSARLIYEAPNIKIYELPESSGALRPPVEKGGIVEGAPFNVNFNILNQIDQLASFGP